MRLITAPFFLLISLSPSFFSGGEGKVLVLASDRGEVHTFKAGELLQVKVRDGSKWAGVLQHVEPDFLVLGVRRIDYEAIVWLRRYAHGREVAGKVLTGVGPALTIGGLALGASAEDGSRVGAATLTGLGLGITAAGIITLATRKKLRTRNFRMLVLDGDDAVE